MGSEHPVREIVIQQKGLLRWWMVSLTPRQRVGIKWVSSAALLGLIGWCFQEFSQLRGWMNLLASRIILGVMGLACLGLGCILTATWSHKVRLIARTVVVIVTVVGVIGLDIWAPKPVPIIPSPPSEPVARQPDRKPPEPETGPPKTPQVEPSPPKERAHIRIEEPRLSAPEIRIGTTIEVSVYCRNITTTIIPARDVFCPSRFAVVLTDSNHEVSVKHQNAFYRLFERDLPALRQPRGEGPTIFPPEAQYGTNKLELDERAVRWLSTGIGTIMVVSLVFFKDDFGPHRTESCFLLHSSINELPRVWEVCKVHTGIKY